MTSSHFSYLRAVFKAAVLLLVFAIAVAMQQTLAEAATTYPTSIITVPRAPIVLTHCSTAFNDYVLVGETNLTNRSDAFLTQFEVRWTFFDHTNTAIGQRDQSYDLPSLAPSDTYTHNEQVYVTISESVAAIGRATCRLQSAKFEGGRSWHFGRGPWKGRLSPL